MPKRDNIKLDSVRGFSQVFNDTIVFIRQEFKVLGPGMLYIAGPFMVFSAMIMVLWMYDISTFGSRAGADLVGATNGLINSSVIYYSLLVALKLLENMMMAGVSCYYFRLYREKGSLGFTVGDLAREVFRHFPALLGTSLFFFLLLLIVALLLGLLVAGIGMIGVGGAILFMFLLMIGMLLVAPPVWSYVYMVYAIRITERTGLFEAMSRARWSMSGNYWSTWLVIFVFGLGNMLIGYSMSAPQWLFNAVSEAASFKELIDVDQQLLIMSVLIFLSQFSTSYIGSSIFVANGLHYFSLREKIHGQGMNEMIAQIGRAPEPEIEATY